MLLCNGTELPGFGLGCWPLGGDAWGAQDDAVSIHTLRRALDLGITHFDTAQVYGRGHGEELLGAVLDGCSQELFIATKLLYTNKDRVEKALSYSCKRLRRKSFDLVYIHWPKKGGDLSGMMEGLETARQKGIIRFIGVSNFSVCAMQEVMKSGTIDACQLGYSLLWRKGEQEIIPFCRSNGIALVSYGSLAEGILTGKFGSLVRFAEGDHRQRTVLFDQMIWPKVHTAVEEMKKIVNEAGATLPQCAIRWLMQLAGVRSVLVGARTPQQVEENSKALHASISPDVLSRLTGISDRLMSELPDEGNVFRWNP
jgi:myo-inositol catabolism protein IolS